jgi:hypothetical protein
VPRYLIERTFPEGLSIPVTEAGAALCRAVVDTNAQDGGCAPRGGPQQAADLEDQ